jgi:hypothetical protein
VEYLIVLVVVVVGVSVIAAPLRAGRTHLDESGADRVAELEAARDAKYREIRDAELDVQTGKLSDDDFAALDGTLRAEAVDILHELDRAREQLPSAP